MEAVSSALTQSLRLDSSDHDVHGLQDTVHLLQSQLRQLQADNAAEFETITDVRRKLNQSENEKVELTSKHNQEVLILDSQVMRLRAELEKGEALRQDLEYDLALSRKEACAEKRLFEEKIVLAVKTNDEMKAYALELQQKVSDLERALRICKQTAEEEQCRLWLDLDSQKKLNKDSHSQMKRISAERVQLEQVIKEQKEMLTKLQSTLHLAEEEKCKQSEVLRRQTCELESFSQREAKMKKDLEIAQQRLRSLEDSNEAERASHLESKFNSEIVQLRLRDLEASLEVERLARSSAESNLEMIRDQFRQLEMAYEKERAQVQQTAERLHQFEKESTAMVKQMSQEMEDKKKSIADLSIQLQTNEKISANFNKELNLAKKRQAYLEETYGGHIRDLDMLLENFGIASLTPAAHTEQEKGQGPSAVLQSLRLTLTDYQGRLRENSNELDKMKRLCEQMREECQSSKELAWTRNKTLEDLQAQLLAANTEVVNQRAQADERVGSMASLQSEVQRLQASWDAEKAHSADAYTQLNKLRQAFEEDVQEKLTFLHELYQRLVAGCVVIHPPKSILGQFTWAELCSILQENVDALTMDLNRNLEKVAHLERLCNGKEEAMKELKKRQDASVNRLLEGMREKEEGWHKAKVALEQHYTRLLGEVHTHAQKSQASASDLRGKVNELTCEQERLMAELVSLQEQLSRGVDERAALLTACALLSGAIIPLRARAQALATQRLFLAQRADKCDHFCKQLAALGKALSLELKGVQQKSPETRLDELASASKGKLASSSKRKGLLRFRLAVVVVLGANRLQRLGGSTRSIFTWTEGTGDNGAMLVCTGKVKPSEGHMSSKQATKDRVFAALSWFSSPELQTAIIHSMSELQQVIKQTELHGASLGQSIVTAARAAFANLLDHLSIEMEWSVGSNNLHYEWREPDSLAWLLNQRLTKITARGHGDEQSTQYTMQHCVGLVQKQLLEFTERLHAAEVERRANRLELAQTRDLRRHADHSRSLKKELQELRQVTQNLVPVEQFNGVCEELKSALAREQLAQHLLRDQAHQLQELGDRLQQHASQDTEKEQTLAEAVKGLSEAKLEVRRKEHAVQQLNRRLAQMENERRRLYDAIKGTEDVLRSSTRSKENVTNYMKCLDQSLQQVREQLSLSWATGELALQPATLVLEKAIADGACLGVEAGICQSVVRSVSDVLQAAWLRISALEKEIASHRQHITMLKGELHTACLRAEGQVTDACVDAWRNVSKLEWGCAGEVPRGSDRAHGASSAGHHTGPLEGSRGLPRDSTPAAELHVGLSSSERDASQGGRPRSRARSDPTARSVGTRHSQRRSPFR
uniref:Coiled-coil domain-containing protein 171 n=1 Tax=Petromyzon marinus TaxID=7757 RepID=A0AAJ7WMT6_PETMA|nr:coiled-coil domain-containing protein 171 [Petromyzon marinus]XP_032803593.1 coiled-coil domain-containing protein 171 [Petromyzon marinus]